jgi:hypothetical protein
MLGSVAPYLAAAFGMALAGAGALALIYTVGHLDPPEAPPSASPRVEKRSPS